MYFMDEFFDYLIELDEPTSDGGIWDMAKLRDDAPEAAIKAFEKYKQDLEADLAEGIFS
ncbi:MAG: hypothetical protein FWH48_04375 [Oscillospiraceae bacterium]|nr:hypothetical protein [Oscillospiraceae bacterium]